MARSVNIGQKNLNNSQKCQYWPNAFRILDESRTNNKKETDENS